MATAKKLSKQIEAAEEELRQGEIRLKELRQAHKMQEGKERKDRHTERGAMIENMLPDTVTLTDEQIKTFLEMTITTDFALGKLAKLKEQNAEDTGEKSETKRTVAGE